MRQVVDAAIKQITSVESERPLEKKGKKTRILLVDSPSYIQENWQEELKEEGYDVPGRWVGRGGGHPCGILPS